MTERTSALSYYDGVRRHTLRQREHPPYLITTVSEDTHKYWENIRPILLRRCQKTHTKTERTSALSYYDGVRRHTQRQREHPPYLSTTVSEDTHKKTDRTSALSYYDGVRGHTQRLRENPPSLITTVSEDTHKDWENIRPLLLRRCQKTHTKTERTSALSYYDGVRRHTLRQRKHPPYLSTTVSEDTHQDWENIRPILVRRCQKTHTKTERTCALS